MSQRDLPPPPPDTIPEAPAFPEKSRYQRPRSYVSWWGLLIGILLGAGGGIFYAWNVAPVEEFDTKPYQLNAEDRADYVVAITLNYHHDGDLAKAVEQLIDLRLGDDPIQAVADIACDLARRGYVDTSSGLRAVRTMKTFYQLQGRTGCADTLIPDVDEIPIVTVEVPTATPTIPPPPSKTPTPAEAQVTPTTKFVVPTTAPRRDFEGRLVGTFCDPTVPGTIEVFVQAFNGDGLPGESVRVRWDDGEDLFISGLKTERGPSFADFEMDTGLGYVIDMPGRSDPVASPLVAEPCFTEDSIESVTSYRVVFRQVG